MAGNTPTALFPRKPWAFIPKPEIASARNFRRMGGGGVGMAGTHSRRSFFPLALVMALTCQSALLCFSEFPKSSALSLFFPVDNNKKPWGGGDSGKGLLTRGDGSGKHAGSLSCIEDAGEAKPTQPRPPAPSSSV